MTLTSKADCSVSTIAATPTLTPDTILPDRLTGCALCFAFGSMTRTIFKKLAVVTKATADFRKILSAALAPGTYCRDWGALHSNTSSHSRQMTRQNVVVGLSFTDLIASATMASASSIPLVIRLLVMAGIPAPD